MYTVMYTALSGCFFVVVTAQTSFIAAISCLTVKTEQVIASHICTAISQSQLEFKPLQVKRAWGPGKTAWEIVLRLKLGRGRSHQASIMQCAVWCLRKMKIQQLKQDESNKNFIVRNNISKTNSPIVFNRPGEAGAVLFLRRFETICFPKPKRRN